MEPVEWLLMAAAVTVGVWASGQIAVTRQPKRPPRPMAFWSSFFDETRPDQSVTANRPKESIEASYAPQAPALGLKEVVPLISVKTTWKGA